MTVSRSAIASTQSWSTLAKVCMPYDLNGLSMPNGTFNYTFACANTTTTGATAYTTSLGSQCNSNSLCTGSGSCCAARSYQLWGNTASLPSYCLSDSTKAGNYFWATYSIT